MEIRVPHLAEGVTSGTVVNVFVKKGDQVKKNQDVLELETKKAVAAIPSPAEGIVTDILCKEGDEVAVGQVVLKVSDNGAATGTREAAKPKQESRPEPSYQQPKTAEPVKATAGQEYHYESKSGFPPPASPTVRRVAKELGIDLSRVRGTEAGGRIAMHDLRAYIQYLQEAASRPQAAVPQAAQPAAKPAAPSVDFSKWGPVEKTKMSQLRRAISEQMVNSWTAIPHVTQFAEADVTRISDLRERYAAAYEKQGARLTLTSFIAKAVVKMLVKHPILNSSMDENTHEIIIKKYVNLGIAVATEQGLIVPVIRDAHKKDVLQLSKDLAALAEKTRQRKVSLEELQGGSFTISNQGSIGGSYFTPIINKPEVAILGVGRGAEKPVAVSGKIETRTIVPLGMSYDHRVLDGADAAKFITELVRQIENFDEGDVKLGSSKAEPAGARKRK